MEAAHDLKPARVSPPASGKPSRGRDKPLFHRVCGGLGGLPILGYRGRTSRGIFHLLHGALLEAVIRRDEIQGTDFVGLAGWSEGS